MKAFTLKLIIILSAIQINLNAEAEIETKVKNKLEIANNLFKTYNDSCIQIASEALELSKSIKFIKGQVESREFLALAFKNFGFNQRAIENLNEALIYNEKLEDKSHIAENYRMLGESYRVAILYDKSLDYLNQAKNIFISIKDSIGIAKTYNRFASVYFEMFNSLNANNQLKKNNYSDSILISIKKSNFICNRIKLNQILVSNYNILGTFYNSINVDDSSLMYFNFAIEISKQNNYLNEYTETLISKSELLMKSKKYEDALDCLDSAYFLSNLLNAPGYKRVCLSIKYLCYWKKGFYEKALLTLDTLNKYEVIIYDKTLKANSNIMQNYYEEKRITDQLEISKQRISYTVVFASIVLILFTLIIFILRKANKEHKEINSQLKILNNTKDKFYSIIAHDLKNPLGSFRQVTSLLTDNYNDIEEKDRIEFLQLMKESSKNLYSLLENLLEWSRTQRGLITFLPNVYDLNMITEEIFDLLKLTAENKNIRLINKVPLRYTAVFDLNLMKIIIRNLISNSIKFTQTDGIIEVGSYLKGKENIIYIKDSGIGMSKDTIDKLFKIEESISTLGTSNEKGTGLGLILCKEFVEKHNGKIWVESELGIGSKFNFSIPII